MGAFLRASALLIVLVFVGSTSGCMPVWEQVQARIAPGDQPAAPLRLDPPSAPRPAASTAKPDIKPVEIAAVPDLDDFEMASGPASDRHPAVTQIEAFGEEVLIVLENEALDGGERISRFRQLLARDLDIDLIGRFILGRHWKSADDAQRADYLAVFSSFLVQTYSTRLGGVRIDDFDVLEARTIGKKDILVRSVVDHGTRKPVRADWRMRERDGRYLILDLSVEGVSMAVVLRQEFASVLRKQGLDGLIQMLRERTA